MPTASSLSLNDSPSQTLGLGVISEERDRETFSHQTLILTALAAMNNRNHHPTFKADEVEDERIRYMKDKNSHTSVIDAATTILITDTEVLATMTRGVNRLFAIKEVNQEDESRLNSMLASQVDANTSALFLREIDEVLPDSDHDGKKRDHMPDEGVFFRSLTPTNTFTWVQVHPSHRPPTPSANQSKWIRNFGPRSCSWEVVILMSLLSKFLNIC